MITLPGSEFFTLRAIGRGVFAAIAREDSPAFSNAGVVDTGDHILVYDTFNTFRAAIDLQRNIEIITRRIPNYVVISHSHTDHWMGNQVFGDHATILASRQTTEVMNEWAAYFEEIKRNPREYRTQSRELDRRLAGAKDPRLKRHLSWSLKIKQHEYQNLAATNLYLPNQSYDSKLDIYGRDALVKIMSLGAGHTTSDTIMVLPEDRIAFIGDLGFFRTHPYLGGSNLENWVTILDELAVSRIKIFIPGHGPIGTKADLQALKTYLLTLQAMVAAVVNCGGTEEDAAIQPVPDFAANWVGFGRFERSMRYLYQQQINKDSLGVNQTDLSRILNREAETAGYFLDSMDVRPSAISHPQVNSDEM